MQLFCVGDPDFFNWNRVFVRYCDGASFSGNSSLPADEKVVALFTTFDSSGCICRIEELFLLAQDLEPHWQRVQLWLVVYFPLLCGSIELCLGTLKFQVELLIWKENERHNCWKR
jgi:hypothetical protein